MIDYRNQTFERRQVVVGSPDCPTVAWRGRKGRVMWSSWGNTYEVVWDGNVRRSWVRTEHLRPEEVHREW